jgi:MFS family permease
MGRFQHRILVAAGLCFATDAMEVLLLSFLAIVLQAEWGLSQEQTATLTCSVFVGSIVGSLLFGYLADVVLGRKPAFLWTATIICAFGFGTAAANSYTTLVVFRFMVGLGVGGVTVPFDVFAEVCPKPNRGALLLLLGYFWTAGTILVVVVAFISLRGEVNDWRVFVALCGIPCLVSSLCTSSPGGSFFLTDPCFPSHDFRFFFSLFFKLPLSMFRKVLVGSWRKAATKKRWTFCEWRQESMARIQHLFSLLGRICITRMVVLPMTALLGAFHVMAFLSSCNQSGSK